MSKFVSTTLYWGRGVVLYPNFNDARAQLSNRANHFGNDCVCQCFSKNMYMYPET